MKKALVTSFGPFPGVAVNPSRVLMERFAASVRGEAARWAFDVLEVSYAFCRSWVRRTDPAAFRAIVHLGVAPGSPAFRLERFGRNRVAQETLDVRGEAWGRVPIREHGASRIETRFDLDAAMTRLGGQARHVALSEDAGGYLCNFVYYLILGKARRRRARTPILFMHVPNLEGPGAMPLRRQEKLFEAILRALAVIPSPGGRG